MRNERGTRQNKVLIGVNTVVFFSATVFALSLLALTYYISYDRVRSSEGVIGSSIDFVGEQLDGPTTVEVSGKYWKDLLIDPGNKPVLILFMDYECPFTQRLYKEVVDPLLTDNATREIFSYGIVNFPQEFHPQSDNASEVAECVLAEKGQKTYFKYVEDLFKVDFSRFSDQDYLNLYSTDAEDRMELEECLAMETPYISNDLDKAKAMGVNTTPTVFVGRVDSKGDYEGKLITGVHPLEEYLYLLEEYEN